MVTENEKRDKKMHNYCFEMEKYPEILFKSTGFKDLPVRAGIGSEFEFTLLGDLTIKDTTKSISMPVKVILGEKGFHASGSVTLKNYLKEFKIKDPSILIFRVAKELEVLVEVDVPYTILDEL